MSTDRKIVLGMPGYGKQTSAAGRGFWRACRDMSGVWNYYQNGSLLASNFNQLWCLALNLVHHGERVDYFAMLHDDIGPEDFWLDKAISILEANELDVLGVVAPIKDSRGMTSMALANGRCDRERGVWTDDKPDGEYSFYDIRGRLTMHDVYELPETFASDDIGAPLLLNTGCWVAKWNQEWASKVSFCINDRIVFNRACGRFQAQTEPEDWYFSRRLHELGLRVGATRAIALQHEGDTIFLNTRPWGQLPFDTEALQVSPVPGAFPREIPGWLLPAEGKMLADLARDKRVLEIGSYCGLSTVCMARTAQHVTAVDYFDGRGTPVPQDTLAAFRRNIQRHGVADKVAISHPDDPYPLNEYDLAFIDGAHDYDSVRADIQRVRGVIRPDGIIALHDYGQPMHPGIEQAVHELIAEGGELLSVTETIAVVRPPAAIPMEV